MGKKWNKFMDMIGGEQQPLRSEPTAPERFEPELVEPEPEPVQPPKAKHKKPVAHKGRKS